MATEASDLQSVLEAAGVAITRVGDREITGRCPVHVRVVGKEDRSPSWSINVSTGLWICFSCGARGTLSMLLHELTGDESVSAQKFLINAGMQRLTAVDNEVLARDVEANFDPEEFYSFVRVPDSKCNHRNLDPDITWRHGVRWDTNERSWIIPVISAKGQLVGWQAKKTGWFRNRPKGIPMHDTLFGLERFRAKTAVLVESPLDVVRFAAVIPDAQALATFGASITDQQVRLVASVADKVIVAMDNPRIDKAGLAASKHLYKVLNPRYGVRWWNYQETDAKDIGDMTDDEIRYGYEKATVMMPWISL